MKLEVLNIEGKKTGKSVELPDEIFAVEPNTHVIYLAVKQYLAAQRQGTHKAKTRMEVKGSSRKLHKQKGTGGSRKGNIRNPLFKGGGTIFGPEPRDYSIKLNRKVKDLAKVSALSLKAADNKIMVIEDIKIDAPKTKHFVNILKGLQIDVDTQKTMLVLPEQDDTIYLSLRNIPAVNGVVLSDVNVYDIMNANYLVLTESAAKIFAEEEVGAEA